MDSYSGDLQLLHSIIPTTNSCNLKNLLSVNAGPSFYVDIYFTLSSQLFVVLFTCLCITVNKQLCSMCG